jgi:outer membrane protein assembly factor BamE (lipoprotein component of BamABCDE complex)
MQALYAWTETNDMRSTLTRSPLFRRLIGSAFAVGLAATLGGCLGYDGEVQHGYVVDAQTLAQVKPGMSKENTLKVMGTPSTTSTVGGDAWYYISQKTEAKLQFMKPRAKREKGGVAPALPDRSVAMRLSAPGWRAAAARRCW